MNRAFQPWVFGTLAALLCSCAATTVRNTWKSPDCRQPVGKIAVLAIDDRPMVRRGFENRYVAQLARVGAPAIVTYDVLRLDELKDHKAAVAERLAGQGAQALLILRLADQASSYSVAGFDTMGWYDYCYVGFANMYVSYGSETDYFFLETSLYDLKTEKRLWSGVTRTVVRDNTDRVAQMDPVVSDMVAAMRKDGVVR